jgi:hypothetical protein
MTPETRFIAALTKLAAVFRVEISDVLIDCDWEALAGWSIEGLEAGAREVIREARFFPRPVEWAEAAEHWLRARALEHRAQRIALSQSTAPPLTGEDVKKLVAELGGKMQWPSR